MNNLLDCIFAGGPLDGDYTMEPDFFSSDVDNCLHVQMDSGLTHVYRLLDPLAVPLRWEYAGCFRTKEVIK